MEEARLSDSDDDKKQKGKFTKAIEEQIKIDIAT